VGAAAGLIIRLLGGQDRLTLRGIWLQWLRVEIIEGLICKTGLGEQSSIFAADLAGRSRLYGIIAAYRESG
jgi:hypothetical protein